VSRQGITVFVPTRHTQLRSTPIREPHYAAVKVSDLERSGSSTTDYRPARGASGGPGELAELGLVKRSSTEPGRLTPRPGMGRSHSREEHPRVKASLESGSRAGGEPAGRGPRTPAFGAGILLPAQRPTGTRRGRWPTIRGASVATGAIGPHLALNLRDVTPRNP